MNINKTILFSASALSIAVLSGDAEAQAQTWAGL